MEFNHIPVLFKESIDGLKIKEDGIYVDCTFGGGGHSREILTRLKKGKLIAIDQDIDAINNAQGNFRKYGNEFTIVHDNFKNIKIILEKLNVQRIDGALLDLGVSSYQLDNKDRGFSYNYDANLDMRMDVSKKFSAWDVINTYSKNELEKVIAEYGEEKWAKRIAEFIVKHREIKQINTTEELVDIIKEAIPSGARRTGPHPAKRTFQAIRIEVNQELNILQDAIKDICSVLNSKGRICVITFHSLEDRIIKNTFKDLNKDCICPPSYPVCVCNKRRQIDIITRKPIIPSQKEVGNNPRARSAKLRIGEKI